MDFSDFQIPPPRHWPKFEDLCLSLFRQVWRDPTAQKNGRMGQPQQGTDISGEDEGAPVGVQCKGKDAGLGATLTETELRAEVAKAKSFTPPLSHWILATTAPKDARIEQAARQITMENRAAGLFVVQVLGWEDLQSLMSQHIAVIEEHYPDLAPATRIALARISTALEPPTHDLNEAIRTARDAARRDLEKFEHAAGRGKTVELNLEAALGSERKSLSRADLVTTMRSGNTVLIEAEPGAGKSVALIQLSAAVLAESDGDIAAVVLLPELADFGYGPLDDLAGRDAFNAITSGTLAAIARAGRLVLFCDGWNELSGDQRDHVRTVLTRFRRDYAGAGLMIATRALSPLPISDAMHVFLLPTSRDQQLAILAETLGAEAEAFLNRARRTPGMRDLLRTPLYLSVLGDIATMGVLPATREEAVRRFIGRQEERPEHVISLRTTLQDCHRSYLSKIAENLTARGIVPRDNQGESARQSG